MVVQRERLANLPRAHHLEAHGIGQAQRLVGEAPQPSVHCRTLDIAIAEDHLVGGILIEGVEKPEPFPGPRKRAIRICISATTRLVVTSRTPSLIQAWYAFRAGRCLASFGLIAANHPDVSRKAVFTGASAEPGSGFSHIQVCAGEHGIVIGGGAVSRPPFGTALRKKTKHRTLITAFTGIAPHSAPKDLGLGQAALRGETVQQRAVVGGQVHLHRLTEGPGGWFWHKGKLVHVMDVINNMYFRSGQQVSLGLCGDAEPSVPPCLYASA